MGLEIGNNFNNTIRHFKTLFLLRSINTVWFPNLLWTPEQINRWSFIQGLSVKYNGAFENGLGNMTVFE